MAENTRCRAFKFYLRPTAQQRRRLEHLLAVQRELYNAALEERRGAWKWERRPITYYDQCRTLTGIGTVRPDLVEYGVIVCRGTLKRLDEAVRAFYGRCQRGETPGFPRFKGESRFNAVSWPDRFGWKLTEAGRLFVQGIGHIKMTQHRAILGVPKTLAIRRDGNRWFVIVFSAEVPAHPLPETGRAVGLDRGVAVLVALSDGFTIENPRYEAAVLDCLATHQRAVSRARRGSNRRRKAVGALRSVYRKTARQRRDHLHKVSRQLTEEYDVLVLERLEIQNMAKRPRPRPDPQKEGVFLANGAASKAGLNRAIMDAGWGTLARMLVYKAEEAGRQVIFVDPRHTSQRCHECGHVAAGNRVTQAEFWCLRCGHEANADVNAAKNILRAGLAQRLGAESGAA